MLKIFNKPIAWLLALVIMVTATIPTWSVIVALAEDDDPVITTILDFESNEVFRYGPAGKESSSGIYVSGYFGVVSSEKTSGEKSFRRDWGLRALFNNMFSFTPGDSTTYETSVFDFSDADVLVFDFYINNISNWQKVYEGKSYVLMQDGSGVSKAVLLPNGLIQGWNEITINLRNFDGLDLANIKGIRFTPNSSSWTNNGSNPTYPDGEESSVCNVSLRVDNIRKIMYPNDIFEPICEKDKINVLTLGGTFINVELGQFSDDTTSKELIKYTLYTNNTVIDETNLEDCDIRVEDVTGDNVIIEGLKENTLYYFAIKATDEAGNSAYLFVKDAIKTKEADKDIVSNILDFEDDEIFRYGPKGTENTSGIYVPGYFGVVSSESSSGKKSFRRDWGSRALFNNMFSFTPAVDEVFDLSKSDVLAFDFYIDNISNWEKVYAGKAHVLLKDITDNVYAVKFPYDLEQGWNTIEINLNEVTGIALESINAIRITPNTANWSNNGPTLTYPDGEESSVCNVSLRVDNIRKILAPTDTTAPKYNIDVINIFTVGGTFITAEIGQFSDNFTKSENIKYSLYASKTSIDITNVEDCSLKTEELNGISATIRNLDSDTSYYLAVKAIDEAGNSSYLFDSKSVKTKESDKNIATNILDFEESESFRYGPQGTESTSGIYVPGSFGVVSSESTSGEKSFRRDWGFRALFNNMFSFTPDVDRVFDLSYGDVFAFDFYIDNIGNWQKVYEGKAYILFKDSADTVKSVKLPYDLVEGWNTVEINLNEIEGLLFDRVVAIRITPNTDKWSNNATSLEYPNNEDETVCNVSLRVDNIRTIIDPTDTSAPIYDSKTISAASVGGTYITVEYPQFNDNRTLKENLVYTVFASEKPLDISNVDKCEKMVTSQNILIATMKELKSNTKYYVAVKCTDEVGNKKYLFSNTPITTNVDADYICTQIFACESSGTEDKGPPYVSKTRYYNKDIKTQGTASLSGVLSDISLYQNLIVAYRTNTPVDISKCNVLTVDFYIDDIDVFNEYWKGHCFIMFTDEKGAQLHSSKSYMSYEIKGDLVEGWNELQFALNDNIDLSSIWAMRISPDGEWQNNPRYQPKAEGCEVLVSVDNVRAERISIENDKRKPIFDSSYVNATHITYDSVSIAHALASDNFTSSDNMTYEIVVSTSKFTAKNISTIKAQKNRGTGRSGTITGLKANTQYYYAVIAIDEAGNKSNCIIAKEPFKTLNDIKDHWYLLTDCDEDSGVFLSPYEYVPRLPSYTSEPSAQGSTAVRKKLDAGPLWHNQMTLTQLNGDISFATRLNFKIYVDSIDQYEKWWKGHLYLVIADEFGQSVGFDMPSEMEEGWNDVTASLYGKSIDLSRVKSIRVTTNPSMVSSGFYQEEQRIYDVSLIVALDYVTAEFDSSLLPTEAPTDKKAHYITNCDNLEEGGYWNTGVKIDEFEKTEGLASVLKTFGYGQKKANSFTYVSQEPIDMYGAEALHFDLYISNIALLKNRTTLEVKLGSDVIADSKYLAFNLDLNKYQSGWNTVTIDLSSSYDSSMEFDLSNLVLFSLYSTKSIFLKDESLEVRLDNIRMTGDITGAPNDQEESEQPDYNQENSTDGTEQNPSDGLDQNPSDEQVQNPLDETEQNPSNVIDQNPSNKVDQNPSNKVDQNSEDNYSEDQGENSVTYKYEYNEELITETVYETQIINRVEHQKSEDIQKATTKTIVHNKNYPIYVWVLAIGIPIICIVVLTTLLIVGIRINKRSKLV